MWSCVCTCMHGCLCVSFCSDDFYLARHTINLSYVAHALRFLGYPPVISVAGSVHPPQDRSLISTMQLNATSTISTARRKAAPAPFTANEATHRSRVWSARALPEAAAVALSLWNWCNQESSCAAGKRKDHPSTLQSAYCFG